MIDVRIPWEPGKRLGFACNRAMATVKDWVLILDHDVLLLNPNWYAMCERVIEEKGHKAGLISCMTNVIGCPLQRAHMNATQDMNWHYEYAAQREENYKGIVEDVTDNAHKPSGFFLLTHKTAWQDAGGFADKFIGMDTTYGGAVKKADYRIFVMSDLYVYHGYRRAWK